MIPLTGDQIREAYLDFFQERGHLKMPSSSLIPAGDPTLLLTSAGMVPFKPYYSGEQDPPSPRLTSAQKCFRTTDIDIVGDFTHHTMFEMLGNFSIGDYFKSEAIEWAWEFVTEVLKLDPEKIWVTIHYSDQEAGNIWNEKIGIPQDRIITLGDEDNFWGPAGDEGACGPSSELHYDIGEDKGPGLKPGDDTERFIEIWNLVFPQFYQNSNGERVKLPAPGIDTGMGLERVAAIMQGVASAYETDLLLPIRQKVEDLSAKSYGLDDEIDFAIRVVTEHTRSVAFLISDGVVPSNEGRGYVLRRLIRRGIRYARKLNLHSPFMSSIAVEVIERFGNIYPELLQNKAFLLNTLEAEELRFDQTLATGMTLLEGKISLGESITGRDAFLFYDTYGFPLDLTIEIAKEHGIFVDVDAFHAEMESQRQRGRASSQFSGIEDRSKIYESLDIAATQFLGYNATEINATVVAILIGDNSAEVASEGDEIELFLDQTPFYPEGGGQVGDIGFIQGEGFNVEIKDTQRVYADRITHVGIVSQGKVALGDITKATVIPERRLSIARNHTATHLLHSALRNILGNHVRQAGSLVAEDRLRFDFTHIAAVSPEELILIEDAVNSNIRNDLEVIKSESSFNEATQKGALAFFDERYGDTVRTIQIGSGNPVSFELCGGTHINYVGQIGVMKIIGESSVGSGIRRIEALTGEASHEWMNSQLKVLDEVLIKLRTTSANLLPRLDSLLDQVEDAKRFSSSKRKENLKKEAEDLLQLAHEIENVSLLVTEIDSSTPDLMRETGDWLRDKLGSAVIILGTVFQKKPFLIAMVSGDLIAFGVDASLIVKGAAPIMGGGGGGQAKLAQAGGKDIARLKDAMAEAENIAKRQIANCK